MYMKTLLHEKRRKLLAVRSYLLICLPSFLSLSLSHFYFLNHTGCFLAVSLVNLPYAIKGNRFFLSSTVLKSPFCKIKSLEVHRSSCEVGFWRGGLVVFFKQRLRFEHRKGGVFLFSY